MQGIELKDWLTIVAIILGPLFAVQVQKTIERFIEQRNRQLDIFKTLMATRATPLSNAHVEALNRIDVEFYAAKKIKDAWKQLFDHFQYNYPQREDQEYQSKIDRCVDTATELRVTLLYEMAIELGYTFDRVLLKRGAYTPVAHGDIEQDNLTIRKGLTDLFTGKKDFPVVVKTEDK